jgi:hypothetical protein
MTRVVHCKKEPYDVYIGRPSKYGNPFTHIKDKQTKLGCWCSPKPCHGDVLIELIKNLKK